MREKAFELPIADEMDRMSQCIPLLLHALSQDCEMSLRYQKGGGGDGGEGG